MLSTTRSLCLRASSHLGVLSAPPPEPLRASSSSSSDPAPLRKGKGAKAWNAGMGLQGAKKKHFVDYVRTRDGERRETKQIAFSAFFLF